MGDAGDEGEFRFQALRQIAACSCAQDVERPVQRRWRHFCQRLQRLTREIAAIFLQSRLNGLNAGHAEAVIDQRALRGEAEFR